MSATRMLGEEELQELNFVETSGINFPYRNRKYLIDVVADIAREHNAKFIIVAGNAIAGKHLDGELAALLLSVKEEMKSANELIKETNKKLPAGQKQSMVKFDQELKEELKNSFIDEKSQALDEFLPHIENNSQKVKYHIIISENIFDRPIGVKILEELQKRRDDIRLFYDTEEKIPINLEGIEDPRLIVPRRRPWFYKILTGLMQRLIDSFVQRTFSPRPSFVSVGCTGTGANIPFYKGVPCFSIPTLHKIDEQLSTENMVGCLVKKITVRNGKPYIINRTYDFRTLIFNEREIAVGSLVSDFEKEIVDALKPSSASLKSVLFRVNQNRREKLSLQEVKDTLEKLKSRNIVVFDEKGNRYRINEELVKQATCTLKDLMSGTKVHKHVAISCIHIGALKTLYFTLMNDLPDLAVDADALIINGDLKQGIAHNYEYNGELLPFANGKDKQDLLAARIVHHIVWRIFEKRFESIKAKNYDAKDIVSRCLIRLVIKIGNHDAWGYYGKDALPLVLFETEFKSLLLKSISDFCFQNNLRTADLSSITKTVEERFRLVGEIGIVNVNGIKIGVKHPHKSRTLSKSQRIQEVVSFFEEQKVEKPYNVTVVYDANFHEAAAAHVSIFGRTILGVQTGAFLKDTQFENTKDKVVDYGPAKVTVCVNKDNQLIYDEVEFDSTINEQDKKIIFADKISAKDVLCLSSRILKALNWSMPWR